MFTSFHTLAHKLQFYNPYITFVRSESYIHNIVMANKLQKNYAPEQDMPELSKHNNWMAKCLSKEIYAKLRDKETPSGFTLDKVIQTGVDNPGEPKLHSQISDFLYHFYPFDKKYRNVTFQTKRHYS